MYTPLGCGPEVLRCVVFGMTADPVECGACAGGVDGL